jgi:hypothetical protein
MEIQTDAAPPPRAAAREEATPEPVTPPAIPNPSLRLDPALGLVVLEFRDQAGRTSTLPTERELAAYRSLRGRPEPMSAPTPSAGTAAQASPPAPAPSGSLGDVPMKVAMPLAEAAPGIGSPSAADAEPR